MIDPNEIRQFSYVRAGHSSMGRTIEYVGCPFCGREVLTYVWSRCGGGKLCRCGAMLGRENARRNRSEEA